MSIIVAYKQDGKVYMGTDTRVTYRGQPQSAPFEGDYKIRKAESGVLVGMYADQATRKNIFANSDMFTLDKNGRLTKRHIVKEILPKYIKMLDDLGKTKRNPDAPLTSDTALILAYGDKMFTVYSHFLVLECEGFACIGLAGLYASGVLKGTKEPDAEKCVEKALDFASESSMKVGAPFLLINTGDLRYKLIRRNCQ